ncbi:MAG: hypothetical protein WHS88_04915 [Anaerohalosphaeraceae bacterium]
MAAKQYNHKALSEAIRQGQARMKRLMQNTRVEPAIPEPQVPKQPEKKPVSVGIRPVPAERETPYRLNQGTLVAAGAFVLVIAFLIWVNRSKERLETQSVSTPSSTTTGVSAEPPAPKPATPAPTAPAPSRTAQTPPPQPAPTTRPAAPTSTPPAASETRPTQTASAASEPPKPASAEKDHVIVIATYANRDHLVPVQAHFENNGIKTEIMRRGSYYLLVTKDRFDSPLKAGTDGQQMLNKIKSIGAQYKAPDGFESFGRTPFQDAYGMKVKTN